MAAFSRRNLLKTLAVGAGSLAFGARPDLLSPGIRDARADGTGPRRLVIFPIANGVHDYADIGTYNGSPTNFTFGPMTKPIETAGLKDQTVILDNVEMKMPRHDVDTHFFGICQLLTGPFPTAIPNAADPDCLPGNPSIDRYLAGKIGAGLAWPQLNMGTMCDSVTYSWTAAKTSVPSNRNPLDIYSKVFANLTTTGPDAATLRRLARRQSVLDNVTQDLTTFQKRLGTEDRARAEAQLASIRAMEQRLQAASKPNACAKPGSPAAVDYASDTFVPETMRAFIDLTVAAMACDQTRVALMHSYIREYHPPQYNCPWAPASYPNASFHGLSHDDPGDGFQTFVRAKAFHFQLAAELANKLKAIPEGGGTMLDNTLIFVPTEIGNGHENASLQWVTLGGKGLGVKTGQFLKFGSQRGIGNGIAHQRVLVSLLQAMGLSDQTYGDENGSGSGPLPGFFV